MKANDLKILTEARIAKPEAAMPIPAFYIHIFCYKINSVGRGKLKMFLLNLMNHFFLII